MDGENQKIVRLAELEIDLSRIEAYTALLTEEIEASIQLEPDVLMLHAVAIKDRPASLRILEVYASQAAYEAHFRTPHFLKYKSATSGMVTSLRLIEAEAVAMRAK